MKRQEILDILCKDEPESPYPIESLYDLEGLSAKELIEIHAAWKRGDPPKSFTRGGARRRLAEKLGASSSEAKTLAQQAGPALAALNKTCKKNRINLSLKARVKALEDAVFGGKKMEFEKDPKENPKKMPKDKPGPEDHPNEGLEEEELSERAAALVELLGETTEDDF